MKKSSLILVTLLIGSLLAISSCTSNDASSVGSDYGDPLANSPEPIENDFANFSQMENELDDLDELDLGDLEY